MTGAGFVLRMAAREMRASPRRLLLLTASVAVGVAALVAVSSFTDNLRDSVRRQAQSLLGADLSLESRRPLSPSVERLVDTLTRQGARSARLINFDAMAYVPRTTGARMVQVAAISRPSPVLTGRQSSILTIVSPLPGSIATAFSCLYRQVYITP